MKKLNVIALIGTLFLGAHSQAVEISTDLGQPITTVLGRSQTQSFYFEAAQNIGSRFTLGASYLYYGDFGMSGSAETDDTSSVDIDDLNSSIEDYFLGAKGRFFIESVEVSSAFVGLMAGVNFRTIRLGLVSEESHTGPFAAAEIGYRWIVGENFLAGASVEQFLSSNANSISDSGDGWEADASRYEDPTLFKLALGYQFK